MYDTKLNYVSEYGKELIDLLDPKPGENILDLGCGTGDLAYVISQRGSKVIGMDLSRQMLETARKKYPDLQFIFGNAENFTLDEQVDAVFSNAALHWMKRPEKVIGCVWEALKPGGRFVAEMGGQGNVQTVLKAVARVLERDYGIDAAPLNPWYFPSIGEYSTLLERQGFRVTYAVLFDRPTRQMDGPDGLKLWLRGFAESFLREIPVHERDKAVRKIEEEARAALFRDGAWHVDYTRLRFIALKI